MRHLRRTLRTKTVRIDFCRHTPAKPSNYSIDNNDEFNGELKTQRVEN